MKLTQTYRPLVCVHPQDAVCTFAASGSCQWHEREALLERLAQALGALLDWESYSTGEPDVSDLDDEGAAKMRELHIAGRAALEECRRE